MKTYHIPLKKREKIAHDTYAFYFEKPHDFEYHAGQYISLCVEPPEIAGPGGTMRELSLSSSPYEAELATAIRFRESVAKKQFLALKPGDKAYLQGPFGSFRFHHNASPIVLLAGGIGITPLLSMLKQALFEQWENQFFIFFSNRRETDIPFRKELNNVVSSVDTVALFQTLSAEKPEHWQDETGYITAVMVRKFVTNPEHAHYYLSGPQRFVGGMWDILEEMNIPVKRIHGEEFTGY